MNLSASMEANAARVPSPIVNRKFLSRVLRGSALALGLQVAGAGLLYVSQLLIARWLGVTKFGIYAYLIAWVGVLSLLGGLGFSLAVLRFLPEYRTQGSNDKARGFLRVARSLTALSGTALGLFGLGAYELLVGSVDRAPISLLLVGVSLVPLTALANLDSAVARAQGSIVGAYLPSLILRPLLLAVGASAIFVSQHKVSTEQAVIATAASMCCVYGIQRWAAERATYAARSVARTYELRVWLRVALPLLLVAGFMLALNQTDLIVVGAINGVRAAAVYAVASKTSVLVGYVLIAVSAMAAPLFSELYTHGDRLGLQRLATASAHWVFWPTLFIAGALAGLAPFVLKLFGHGFLVARWPLTILLLGQLVNAGCGAVGYLLSMTGHHNDVARVYGIVAAVNIALCSLGGIVAGVVGAACGTAASMAVWNVWLHQLAVRRVGVRTSIVSAVVGFVGQRQAPAR